MSNYEQKTGYQIKSQGNFVETILNIIAVLGCIALFSTAAYEFFADNNTVKQQNKGEIPCVNQLTI